MSSLPAFLQRICFVWTSENNAIRVEIVDYQQGRLYYGKTNDYPSEHYAYWQKELLENVSVADVVKVYVREADSTLVRWAIQVPALAAELRQAFQQQLQA